MAHVTKVHFTFIHFIFPFFTLDYSLFFTSTLFSLNFNAVLYTLSLFLGRWRAKNVRCSFVYSKGTRVTLSLYLLFFSFCSLFLFHRTHSVRSTIFKFKHKRIPLLFHHPLSTLLLPSHIYFTKYLHSLPLSYLYIQEYKNLYGIL